MKLFVTVVLAVLSVSTPGQPKINELSPELQELMQDPWHRALWDISGVLNVVDETSVPPEIDEEWAAKEPDLYPQSWDECAALLDRHRGVLDEMSIHAAGLRSAADMKDQIAYRRIAQVARIDALHAASQGDLDRGARRIATIFDVGRARMTDGGTDHSLEGFAVLTLAATALEDELEQPDPWLTDEHLTPVRDALSRLAQRQMRWPLREELDDRRIEIAERLGALFTKLDVDPGLALNPAPALPPPWQGTWVGTLRFPAMERDNQDFIDEALHNEIRLTFLPVEGDPARATLVIRTELIVGNDFGEFFAAMLRDRDPDEEATRIKLRVVDSAARGWIVETDDIFAEAREQFEEDELAEAEAMFGRYVLSAGQPTDDRFEISMFDPEFKVIHSYRMRLIDDDTMEYETITMTPEPWSGNTVIRQAATMTRTD